MISASNLERIRECPGSESLPHVDTPSDLAERGTAMHVFLANSISGRPLLNGVPAEHHDFCDAIDTTRLPKVGSYLAEMAFAFNVFDRTVRPIEPRHEGGYSDLKHGDIPVTIDAHGLTETAVSVGDWKGAWSKATRAADNLQIRLGALCAARFYGKDEAIVWIARVGEDGPRYDMAELTAIDLDAFESELVDIWHAAQGSKKFAEGEHCRYCPAFDFCPVKFALAQALANPDAEYARAMIAFEQGMDVATDEMRLEILTRYRSAKAVLDRIHSAIVESVKRRPIPLGNGKVYAMVEQRNREIDLGVATAVLSEMFGADIAQKAKRETISFSAIENAVKPKCAPRTWAKTEREIWKALEERGAVSFGAPFEKAAEVKEEKILEVNHATK